MSEHTIAVTHQRLRGAPLTLRRNREPLCLFFSFLKTFSHHSLIYSTVTRAIWPNSTPPILPYLPPPIIPLPPSALLHPLCLFLFLQYTAAGNSTPSPPLCAVALATGTLKIGLSSLLLTFPVHNPTVSTDTMHLVTHSIDPLHISRICTCTAVRCCTGEFLPLDTQRQMMRREELDLTCAAPQSHSQCCSLCLPTLSWGCT